MKSDSIVIIPTYNEKENIEKIIRAVFGLEKKFDILVIDDGSPDGTAAIVKSLIEMSLGIDYIFWKDQVSWDWAQPISWASNGRCSRAMTLFSKWMLISVTTLTTCLAFMLLPTMRDMMWLWVHATYRV